MLVHFGEGVVNVVVYLNSFFYNYNNGFNRMKISENRKKIK